MERSNWLLRLIVVKKLIVSALLLAVSLLAAYGYRHYDGLALLAEQWGEGDRRLLLALLLACTLPLEIIKTVDHPTATHLLVVGLTLVGLVVMFRQWARHGRTSPSREILSPR